MFIINLLNIYLCIIMGGYLGMINTVRGLWREGGIVIWCSAQCTSKFSVHYASIKAVVSVCRNPRNCVVPSIATSLMHSVNHWVIARLYRFISFKLNVLVNVQSFNGNTTNKVKIYFDFLFPFYVAKCGLGIGVFFAITVKRKLRI